MAGPPPVTILGIIRASAGLTRRPAAGNSASGAAVLTTIHASPAFFGSVRGPTYVAPGGSSRTSPGAARSTAICRSAPAATAMVRGDTAADLAWASLGAAWPGTPAHSTAGVMRTHINGQARNEWFGMLIPPVQEARHGLVGTSGSLVRRS